MKTMPLLISALIALISLAPAGCKSADDDPRHKRVKDKLEAGKAAAPPEFKISPKQVLTATGLAPNKVYLDQGLGVKAAAGNTFVCVEYTIDNTGASAANAALPKLIDAAGTSYEVDGDAAGKMPWKSGFRLTKIEPGAGQTGFRCYQTPESAAGAGMKLHFEDTGWGNQGGWKQVIDLPAPTPSPGY